MEHETLAKVMEFCDQSLIFTNFAPELCHICAIVADIRKFSFGLESLHFLTFSAICHQCKL